MSRVVDLRPGQTLIQCSKTIAEMTSPATQFYSEYRKKKAAKTGKNIECCQKSAKYLIDGKPYCAQHGGIEAIGILKKAWPLVLSSKD